MTKYTMLFLFLVVSGCASTDTRSNYSEIEEIDRICLAVPCPGDSAFLEFYDTQGHRYSVYMKGQCTEDLTKVGEIYLDSNYYKLNLQRPARESEVVRLMEVLHKYRKKVFPEDRAKVIDELGRRHLDKYMVPLHDADALIAINAILEHGSHRKTADSGLEHLNRALLASE